MLNLNVSTMKNHDLHINGVLSAEFLGKDILVTEQNGQKFVIKIMPVIDSNPKINKPKPKFGSAKGQIIIHDDFDEPLPEFADYMP